jgi:hypothetical protein
MTQLSPPSPPRRNPWPRRVASSALMAAIAWWMVRKVAKHWAEVRDHAGSIHVGTFLLAAAMFALFLFAFRALVWRRIVRGFGYRLPVAAAVRVWSTSELARYVPGVILQVAGRVYLVKPYGVPGTVCTASQLLELIVFLLANVLVAIGCLVTFGLRHVEEMARLWLVVATLLVPLLAMSLHPRVFYGLLGRVTRRLGKPDVPRLPGRELARLLAWNLLGLAWQSVAAFLVVREPLGLGWDKLYVVAGTYCLAWCGGFLAFWSPGGLLVREPIFAGVMAYAVPDAVLHRFPHRADLVGLLTFLSVVLRLWTIAGEVILTSVAHAADVNGALGRGRRAAARDADLSPVIPASD